MSKYKDISGKQFGALTAIEFLYTKNGQAYWLYKCICGKNHTARSNTINYVCKKYNDKELPSCGCVELKRKTKHGFRKVKDTHPLYKVYRSMVNRCYLKSSAEYKYYGAKDVTVCKEWLDNPKSFIEWGLSNGYKKGLVLDKDILCDRLNIRPKVYSPKTCQFITNKNNVKYAVSRTNSDNKNIKLNEKDVLIIKELVNQGKSKHSLAKYYNVSPNTIYRLFR